MTKQAFLNREAAEYMANLEISQPERQELLSWIEDGNSVNNNPWYMADEKGCTMDYISAMRAISELAHQNSED